VTVLDVKAYKSKYIIVYSDQNARRKHGTKNGNSSFAIQIFVKILTSQNCIREEIKDILK
jgi:hypothetical protein